MDSRPQVGCDYGLLNISNWLTNEIKRDTFNVLGQVVRGWGGTKLACSDKIVLSLWVLEHCFALRRFVYNFDSPVALVNESVTVSTTMTSKTQTADFIFSSKQMTVDFSDSLPVCMKYHVTNKQTPGVDKCK